jgi:outer membrane receptor protein involved in Fe transport
VTQKQILAVCAVFFGMSAIFGGSAQAQTATSLRGTVKDQSGGVVAAAGVTVANTGTGISRSTITGNDGGYLFEPLQVGTYRLTVGKSGFATFIQDGIVLELNQNGRLDVTLKVGKTSETIEVKSNIVQVDTTSAVLGKVENERMIRDLPLVERDTLQLGLLQAGVFAPDPDDGSGNPFSVSGQRSESLTFLLDGADNTDFLGNNILVSPNPDAVAEFKILTNNYDAQYGRTSGGIVNQITKSGTNQFHGDLFEFLRNDVLNAHNYFLPDTPPFKRNVFGGTIGGPIKKEKTFFFLAYQGARRREATPTPVLTVLSQNERSGDFGELCPPFSGGPGFNGAGNCVNPNGTQLTNPITGNPIPFNNMQTAGLVNPIIQKYIQRYLPPPLPNGNTSFVAAPVGSTDDDQGILHLDHNFGPHDTLSFVYVVDDQREILPFFVNKGASTGGNVPVGSGFATSFRTQVGTISWAHTFSGNMVNEFRFSANRSGELNDVPQDKTTPAALGFTNVNPDDAHGAAPPIMFTPSFNLGPPPGGPTVQAKVVFRWADNLTWTHGKHEWKFGGDVSRVRNNFNFDFFNNGSYDFDSFVNFTGDANADFVGGFWDNYFQFSNAIYGIRTGSFAVFAQDTWEMTSRLTVNLGLRYEYYIPQSDVHNNILGFFPGRQSTVFPNAPPSILYPSDPGTPNKALVYPDRNNFAPRFGFAWDMFGTAKLVMRGGVGIFYDIEDGGLNLQFGGQPPFGAVSNMFPTPTNYFGFAGDPVSDPYLLAFGDSTQNPFPFRSRGLTGTFLTPKIPFAYTTDPHFRTPYSINYNYGFQWQAARDTMVEAVYVGSLGRKLISSGETNFPVPSVMQQQLNNFGTVNIDCARPLAACVEPGNIPVTGPNADANALPTGATQLLTNFSNGTSDSHQFQLTVDKRFSKGFALRGAYTLSKTIDLTSGFRSRSAQYTDPLNPRLDRALADFDTPQRLVISGIWELPFDRGFENKVMKFLSQGWQVNVIASFQKGNPFTLYSNDNQSQQNNFLDRPDKIGAIRYFNPHHVNSFASSNTTNTPGSTSTCLGSDVTNGHFYFDPTAFDCLNPALFTFGTLSRNALRGPGINNWDLSIVKKTRIGEGAKSVEFRAEFFNAFNHTQFTNPDNAGFSGTFGQVTSTRVDARIIQFGLKLYF